MRLRPGRRARALFVWIPVVLVTALIAGCGGGGGNDSSTTAAQAPQGAAQVVVEASGGSFNPAQIYKDVSPGVVTIDSVFEGGVNDILGGGGSAGQGSGFVVDKDGDIVTNAHVVTSGGHLNGGGTPHEAKQVFVEFGDRNRVPAEVKGFDADADVALIKVDPDGLDLQPVSLSDRSSFTVGEPVAAIGSPFGEDQSLSVGVISATNRTVEGLTNFGIDNAIQTDASINPGNSGGPLLDAKGQVIGINEQIASSSGSNSGVGFAIPVTSVRYSLDQLKVDGKVDYAYLGVTSESLYPQLSEHLGLDTQTGAMITDVVSGSPADDAGLKGSSGEDTFQLQRVKTGGDVVLAVDGKPVLENNDLSKLVAAHKPGETVTLEVLRNGQKTNVDVTLGSRPADVNQ
ncbi:MAG TPA: trypsin-like peptidase domain-containing protein [Solirubrobacterales bacterium]|jgi:S1-C subfamily serine protease|nr:trypsin-like peptidase domain-containing protein [Solirubrobacterales bacterium]